MIGVLYGTHELYPDRDYCMYCHLARMSLVMSQPCLKNGRTLDEWREVEDE